jgi:CHY zinc finger
MSEEVLMDDDIDMIDSDDDDLDDDDDDMPNDSNDIEANASDAGEQDKPEEDAAISRRRAIQAIMSDSSLSEEERRMRIQSLMSGGRMEVVAPRAPVLPEQDLSACVHYERNCLIVAPCCNRIFGCRVCHDELSPSGHPPMDRFAIQEVVCKRCNTRQPTSYVSPDFFILNF